METFLSAGGWPRSGVRATSLHQLMSRHQNSQAVGSTNATHGAGCMKVQVGAAEHRRLILSLALFTGHCPDYAQPPTPNHNYETVSSCLHPSESSVGA